MANITKSFVDHITPTGKQVIYWDNKLKGFGINVGSQSKTFIVQYDINGKTRRKKIGRYSEALTVAKARERARSWLGDLAMGVIPWEVEAAQAALTLEQAWKEFINIKKVKGKKGGGDMSPASIRVYEHSINYLKSWYKRDLSTIKLDDVEAMHQKIGQIHGHYQANGVFRLFRAIYNRAMARNESLVKNPTKDLEWYPEEAREGVGMKADDLPVFWRLLDEKIVNPMRRDYYRLLLFTGLRKTSACSIRVEDIDLAAKTLHIPNPKGGKEKKFDLPLSDYLCTLIAGLLEGNESEWLFPSRKSATGHIMEPKERPFIRVLEAEIDHRFIIHGLRNTFITTAAELDISEYKIKLLVNHALPKKTNITARYADPSVESLREPMQRITTRLLSLVEPEQNKVVEIRR